MPAGDEHRETTRQWVAKAEEDRMAALTLARVHGLKAAGPVCFHVQQCVEKYLKAVLVWMAIPFSKTHDIEELVAMLPSGQDQFPGVTEQRRLTSYAVFTRYPGSWDPMKLAELRGALKSGNIFRTEARKLLPSDRGKKRSRRA